MFNSRALKAHRLHQGLTQQQLAEKAGTTRVSIARYESGKSPSGEVLPRLAEALGIKVGVFFEDDVYLPRHDVA